MERNLFPSKKLVQVIRPEKICVGVFGILEGVFGIWNVYLEGVFVFWNVYLVLILPQKRNSSHPRAWLETILSCTWLYLNA